MNNVAKCGSGTILTPTYLEKSFGSPAGSLKMTTGDSCLWTIQGNKSDFTTALSLKVNTLVGLSVSIFNGPTFSQSLLISENLTASFRLYLPLLNNTYILASPLPSNLKTATLNLSYSLLSNVYRLPPPETIKSMT
jgi:hypothetical protein